MHPLAAPGALWVLSRAGKVPRPPAGGRNLPQEIDCLWMARKRCFLAFSVSQRVSPLRRRPKGFPVALWKPSGPLAAKGRQEEQLFCGRQGKGPSLLEGFASAEATRGLSARPLDPFGSYPPLPQSHLPVVFVHINQKMPKQQTPLPCPISCITLVKI